MAEERERKIENRQKQVGWDSWIVLSCVGDGSLHRHAIIEPENKGGKNTSNGVRMHSSITNRARSTANDDDGVGIDRRGFSSIVIDKQHQKRSTAERRALVHG